MKKLNSITIAVGMLALVGAAMLAVGCKHMESHKHVHTYTCPMHPEVVQNTPGKCPKCGMDLEHKD